MRRTVLLALAALSLSVPGLARADALTVTSGIFRIGLELDDFRFTGNGFDLIGALPPPEHIPGVLAPVADPHQQDVGRFPPRPGQLMDGAGAAWVLEIGEERVQLRGQILQPVEGHREGRLIIVNEDGQREHLAGPTGRA